MISIVYPYYNNKEMLKFQIEKWRSFPKSVEFIIIDDGSKEKIDRKIFPYELNIKSFRIKEDIPWNISGAKNLGVIFSNSDAILLSDIDRVFEPKTIINLTFLDLENTYYLFNQINSDGSERGGFHQGTIFVSKYNYWKVGGLDEDYSGAYGHEDGNLLKKFKNIGLERKVLLDRVICYDRSKIKDATTPSDLYGDRHKNGELTIQKKGRIPKKLDILRFGWE